MTKLNKWIILNCFISLIMFCFIFYKNVGVSGGDMAIYALNIIFGIIQIITLIILIWKKDNSFYKVILFILLFQIIEIILMSVWGNTMNAFFKSY
ncbi:hypothetical protein [Lacinutrix undariae]